MRKSLPLIVLGLAALAAAPASALTVQPAPNRDAAPHLKDSGGSTSTPLRDTWAGSARPSGGSAFVSSSGGIDEIQTFSYGGVTSTVRSGNSYDRSGFQDRTLGGGFYLDRFDRSTPFDRSNSNPSQLTPRRR